jgi:hypothetical protein
VSLGVSPLTTARQGLSKHVSAATNTSATIEELLDVLFSVKCVSYQRKSRRLVLPRTSCFNLISFLCVVLFNALR